MVLKFRSNLFETGLRLREAFLLLIIDCFPLIIGIMLEAIDFLLLLVMLLSLLALRSAISLKTTFGTNAMILSIACLRVLGLATTWRQVVADLSVQNAQCACSIVCHA